MGLFTGSSLLIITAILADTTIWANNLQATITVSADGSEKVLCERMNGFCQEPDDRCLGMRVYNESLAMKYCGTEMGNTVCCAPSGQVFTADIENSLSFALRNTIIY